MLSIGLTEDNRIALTVLQSSKDGHTPIVTESLSLELAVLLARQVVELAELASK